jgi:uncharacterized protein DUF2817
MDSFSKTYIEARSKFIAAASDAAARMYAYGGDEVAEGAAIVIAGLHGADGYGGSAIQHRWLSAEAARYNSGECRTHAAAGWATRVRRCRKRT